MFFALFLFVVHAGLFSCFYNPLNSDMDCGVFIYIYISFCMGDLKLKLVSSDIQIFSEYFCGIKGKEEITGPVYAGLL